jgi:hypothetical protein
MRRIRANPGRRCLVGLFAAGALLAALTGATPAMAEGSAAWLQLSSSSTPTYLAPGGEGTVVATATNLGNANVTGAEHPVTITDKLPPGLEVTGTTPVVCPIGSPALPVCGKKWPAAHTLVQFPKCTASPHEVTCTFAETLAPFEQWEVDITVKVSAGIESGSKSEVNSVAVEGGGVESRSLQRALTVSNELTPFGIEDYEVTPENDHGGAEAQAASHPYQFTTTLAFNRIYFKYGNELTLPSVPIPAKDVHVNLPPGLIGNANKKIIPQCTELQFTTVLNNNISNECPANTAIGAAVVSITEPDGLHNTFTLPVPVYNLVPSVGEPARFGFLALSVPVTLDTTVREGDYHVVVNVNNASEEPALFSSVVSIWGVPGDARHNQSRGFQCIARESFLVPGETCEAPKEPIKAPFLTLPTSCAEPLQTSVQVKSWAQGASPLEPVPPTSPTETLQGCAQVPFTPTMSVQPTQHESNTPTGLKVVLKVPQKALEEEGGLAQANVKDTTVKLPEGVQLSPSAANGLQSCSLGQIGFTGANPRTGTDEFSSAKPTCPEASKVGTVRIKTPILEHELQGSVYLAAQSENPFNSLFGIYIVVEDPNTGVLVKIAGKVKLDENTGRVESTFPSAPQLPFEELELELLSGPRASIVTPRACGNYGTFASLTPWSGTPAVEPVLNAAEFNINSGPHGTGCANLQPFNPGFAAGTNRQAGAFTPFTLTLTRGDTDQALKSVSVTLPPGIAGLLSQVKQCPDPQANAGTCGEESLIGRATAVAGLGSDPFTETGGRVYITGPYNGAPFGLSIVIPAKAGPFDFGNVVTRSTINVDRNTAALTINSELPTMLNTTTVHTGVPVQLRQVEVTIERPGGAPFQFNPTNCSPMQITGSLGGDQGASVPIAYPFQAVGCEKLPFAPTLTAETNANVTKVNGTSLVVKVTSSPGQANIGKTRIEFPEQLPSRLTTIQKACPDAVFEANPATCPEGSLIGTATAHTPVLNSPLTGPAYLVSHGGAAFPDAEFVLQGEGITLILDGLTDIKKGVTSSTFNAVPDAPISTFEVTLPAGPHSAFTGFGNLCSPTKTVTKRVLVPKHVGKKIVHVRRTVTVTVADPLKMPTILTGQNGNVIQKSTPLVVSGCKAVKSFKVTKHKAKKKTKKKTKKKKK